MGKSNDEAFVRAPGLEKAKQHNLLVHRTDRCLLVPVYHCAISSIFPENGNLENSLIQKASQHDRLVMLLIVRRVNQGKCAFFRDGAELLHLVRVVF